MFIFIFIFLCFSFVIFPEDALNHPQELFSVLDRTMKLQDGYIKAEVFHKEKDLITKKKILKFYQKANQRRVVIEEPENFMTHRIEYNQQKLNITHHNLLSKQVENKTYIDRYERITDLYFSFMDISPFSYEALYKIEKSTLEKGEKYTFQKTIATSLLDYGYSKVELYSDYKTKSPTILFIYDSFGLLLKKIQFQYGDILIVQNKRKFRTTGLKSIQCIDPKTDNSTTIRFLEINKDLQIYL